MTLPSRLAAAALLALVAVTALVATQAVVPDVDTAVRDWVARHRRPGATDLADLLVAAGEPVVVAAAALLTVIARWPQWRGVVVRAAVAGSVALGAVETLKILIGRAGPSFGDPASAVFVGGESYPSGHAAGATVAFGLVLLARPAAPRAARLAAVAVPVGTGLAMVYGPAHWLSDAVGGWLIGGLAVWVAWRVTRGRAAPAAAEPPRPRRPASP